MAYDEALAQRIRRLLNGPDVAERKMFGGLAFLVGGRMCCGVQDSDLMVRVPKDQHAQLLTEPHVRPMDFTVRSLAGFVYVSATGTKSDAALRRWVALGVQVALEATSATTGVARRRSARRAR
ncbi:MAG: TfoX/Sxy family protein [Vicinamibacterales bacterium]